VQEKLRSIVGSGQGHRQVDLEESLKDHAQGGRKKRKNKVGKDGKTVFTPSVKPARYVCGQL
jgi:hypothetical protein